MSGLPSQSPMGGRKSVSRAFKSHVVQVKLYDADDEITTTGSLTIPFFLFSFFLFSLHKMI